MAENPFAKLARLVGGAAILPGPLAHQVLGQLLISGSTATELAGANVVLAAVSRQTNAAVQVAVRSMVPAVLAEVLISKERQRLEGLKAAYKKLERQPRQDELLAEVLKHRYEAESHAPVKKAVKYLLGEPAADESGMLDTPDNETGGTESGNRRGGKKGQGGNRGQRAP
ncbi:MAG: hypothetical protein QNJ04_13600 [Desulfobacterales bacterium]|nr:hypothetical protein [Desulfobacterales bacterium]